MFLDDLQKRFEEMQGKANWKAVFGEVLEVDGRRLIPVASVQYGFGMGGGQGPTGRGGTSWLACSKQRAFTSYSASELSSGSRLTSSSFCSS